MAVIAVANECSCVYKCCGSGNSTGSHLNTKLNSTFTNYRLFCNHPVRTEHHYSLAMEPGWIDVLHSGDPQRSIQALQIFNARHGNQFDFSAFDAGEWSKIWTGIFRLFERPLTDFGSPSDFFAATLCAIRILSRNKYAVDETITAKQFNQLLSFADIGTEHLPHLDTPIRVEAVKCLCNLVFQSANCQLMCLKNSAIDGLVRRLRTYNAWDNPSGPPHLLLYRNADSLYDLRRFDMKLLFLLTALNTNLRTKVRDDYHGLPYLVEILDVIIKDNVSADSNGIKRLDDRPVDLLVDVMKVLFNITVRNELSVDNEDEEDVQFRRLAGILHDLLSCHGSTTDKHIEMCAHAINLLTNVPAACYSELVSAVHTNDVPGEAMSSESDASAASVFDGHNVQIMEVLLGFLKYRLDNVQNVAAYQEMLSPILTVMVKSARCNPLLRHYLKSKVLPPLRDVRNRPEVGDDLKNQLVRLLTTPATQVRDLVADFLFVLCKENVGRMIKYTGYGNAAGLFANRGILPVPDQNADCYSSDNSDDSDTDEYKEMRNHINPVVGCYEPPRPNPFDGMSDEQKEYEAMKLVELMDQLNRCGIVQPCRIGDDGRPVAVEHILELQDNKSPHQMDHQDM